MKIYKLPFRSRVAQRLLFLVPDRMWGLIAISTLDEVDDLMETVHTLDEDGGQSIYDAVSFFRIEKWRRAIWRNAVKATLEEK